MVYLVRTTKIIKVGAWELATKTAAYFRDNYPEIKESTLLSKISGAQDIIHWVLGFESLADEEKFALKAAEDEWFRNTMKDFNDFFTDLRDDLFRVEM